ncbi:MAG: acetylserotonin O-methyltransferase [Burkholderiaceae bacterium]|nr:acetylserotonin O-methyltransferase [Burkholderiaceae bacterium]
MSKETRETIDTTRLQRFARAYCESAVLFAAIDLELFTHVARGADTEDKLASALDISGLRVERLVNAALAMKLMSIDGGTLRNAADASRYLVKGQPTYAADWLTFTRADVPKWFQLTEALTSHQPPSVLGMYDDLTVEQARSYHASTYSIGTGAARRFTKRVDLSGRRRLLDLGGGSGAYSIQAVKMYPQLSAIVLDLPPVTEVAKEYIRDANVEDRVSVLPGDFTSTPFPDDVDVVLMASNMALYEEAVIADIVRRVHDALVPGGEFHLVGEMLDDDRGGPLDAALWGIGEAVNHSRGKAHTIGQSLGYFRDAGFNKITHSVFVSGTLYHVVGVKNS